MVSTQSAIRSRLTSEYLTEDQPKIHVRKKFQRTRRGKESKGWKSTPHSVSAHGGPISNRWSTEKHRTTAHACDLCANNFSKLVRKKKKNRWSEKSIPMSHASVKTAKYKLSKIPLRNEHYRENTFQNSGRLQQSRAEQRK